jgi:hypothetical protein
MRFVPISVAALVVVVFFSFGGWLRGIGWTFTTQGDVDTLTSPTEVSKSIEAPLLNLNETVKRNETLKRQNETVKQNETLKQNETVKQNETLKQDEMVKQNVTLRRNETLQNETLQNGTLQNGTLQNGTLTRTKGVVESVVAKKNSSLIDSGQVVVVVNTCLALIPVRSKLIVQSWAQAFPSDRVVFASEKPSDALLPYQVWVFPHNQRAVADRKAKEYSEAQGRFMRALAHAAEVFKDRVRWVLLVDDDAFVHAKNLESFISKADESRPVYYGQGTCGGNHSCGGGGLLISMKILQKAANHMKNCQSRVSCFGFLICFLIPPLQRNELFMKLTRCAV